MTEPLPADRDVEPIPMTSDVTETARVGGVNQDAPPRWRGVLFRLCLRLAGLLLIVWLAQTLVMAAMDLTEALPDAYQGPARVSVTALALLLYAALIAIPFVPGVEIGVTLLVLHGASVAPLVYAATFLGLFLAFCAGRVLPYPWLHSLFRDLHLRKACTLISQIAPLSPERRLALLRSRLPDWLGPYLVRYRYLVLAAALNLPGNALIGGGGGLSLVAGLSGLYAPFATGVTVALATAPIPLAVWLLGPGILGA